MRDSLSLFVLPERESGEDKKLHRPKTVEHLSKLCNIRVGHEVEACAR